MLVVGQLVKTAATVRTVKGGAQAVTAIGGRGRGMASLVADKRLGTLESLVTDEAEKQGIPQIGLNKVLWMFSLHMPFLEFLVREGNQAVKALIGTQAI